MKAHLQAWGEDYTECMSTYSIVSRDSGKNESMIVSELPVINYDMVAGFHKKHKQYAKQIKSCDALFLDASGAPFFIEFKNGAFNENDLREKIFPSILMAMDLGLIESLKDACNRASFVLVYNAKRSARDNIKHQLDRISHKVFIHKKAREYKWLFGENVFSYTPDEFAEKFLSKYDAL